MQPSTATARERPRTLTHPGPIAPTRIHSRQSARGRHLRLALQPGRSLFDALVEPLYALGIRSASTTILGGGFSQLFYCVAPVDPTGHAVVAYTAPNEAGVCEMIFGNATLGLSPDGAPLVHCHAAVRTAAGIVRGGHILPTHSVIGEQPVTVLVTVLDDIELRIVFDAETNLSLMQPHPPSFAGARHV